ncbi:hypothetical protein ABLA30_05240 [Xenorhabdus nematophila]|uniref:DUF5405 domain-containing protein n=1 Tax=Xenorhabdus nematophila (strain ATCC 19061 / DSM 3370 / CCUG 14189 / LMG 1036 / NCIMB 9965 / AN6) TaxID=406817 RepID=D3VKN5_XENNA|nr:hypothetical protein [Xenorhabdus nematophila]CBJ91143.1 conserved hypothetical protein [Xenorhabdus nematophila ATCC 19061]CEK23965.1 conserved hypothetical protein [Xenorhabdus nematophila AN6/1]
MRIDLGQYVITSDSRAYTLNKKTVSLRGKNAGREYLTPFRYYTNLRELVRCVIRLGVDGNDIKTLQQLSERIEEIAENFAAREAGC